jgi:competence ComEA-like helix-hairpin-helix protein
MKWSNAIAALILTLSGACILISGTSKANANNQPPPSAAVFVDDEQQIGLLNDFVAADEIGMIIAQADNSTSTESEPSEPIPPESTPSESTASPSTRPEPPAKPQSPCVNINTASETQLTALKGIGPSLAASITAHRAQHGPFKKKDDLQKVKGIGPAKFTGIVEHICL